MEIYVSLIQFGSYEEKFILINYVGTDLEKAKESILNTNCDFGSIEVWVDGEQIREIEVK